MPLRYSTYHCLENCIANFCDAIGIDHRPMFLYSWDFGFDNSMEAIGNKIHCYSSFDLVVEKYLDLAERFLGIKFDVFPNNFDYINNYLKNDNLLMIQIDSYYVPWNLAYQKYHHFHFYFVFYNNDLKCFSIVDSYCSNNIINVESIDVDIVERVYSLETPNDVLFNANIVSLRSLYREFLFNNMINGVYDYISDFGNELLKIESVEDLVRDLSDFSNDVLIRRMSYISKSRFNTKIIFEYLGFMETNIS